MPIVDYKETAQKLKKSFFSDERISQKNKDALKRFLDAYDVSPAREGIFLIAIKRLLIKTDDIQRDMHNREKINSIFKEMSKEVKPATLEMTKNVGKRLVRWLNNDVKPQGFADIKRIKANLQRDLKPKDMINWADGLLLAETTPSLQFKALILTQLDCGFRPSELLDLNYGDVEIKDDMVVFSVKGKTGSRRVWAMRCVPYFLAWYDKHPLKKKDAPLWLIENVKLSHRLDDRTKRIERLTYHAIKKRLELLKEKTRLDKPIDLYNFRHSSCYLDKIDNVPIDLASERHGHSVDFFTSTYGRLSIDDKLTRVRNHYGEPEEKKVLITNQACGRCKAINDPEAEYCRVCGVPLSVATASKVYEERNQMSQQLQRLESLMIEIVTKGGRGKKALALAKEIEKAKA